MSSIPHESPPLTPSAPAGLPQQPVLSGEPTVRAWIVAVAVAVLHATALAWAMAALS